MRKDIPQDIYEICHAMRMVTKEKWPKPCQVFSIEKFLKILPKEVVLEMAKIAVKKCERRRDIFKYFCGCCWNKIKENGG